MSEPVTISVRGLTAEHIGWTAAAGEQVSTITHYAADTTVGWKGRRDLTRYRIGDQITLTPPPPSDRWEGVKMPRHVYAVQWFRDAPIGRLTPVKWFSTRSDAEAWVFKHFTREGDSTPVRIIRLSADGAEVVG